MSRNLLYRTAASLAFLLVVGCGESTGPVDDDGTNGSDATPPSVVSVSPADGATDVDAAATVTVTFTEAVDPASVTAAAFTVGTSTGTIDVSGATATFTPDAPFGGGADLSVRVSGVRDLEGNAMASVFTSSFTVRSEPTDAKAGQDFDASFGQSVTLDPSASSGENLAFTWTQVSGPPVGALSGDAPTFAAPDEVTLLEFELTVSGNGESDSDTVVITVLEDRDHAFFVAPGGDDGNPGTRSAPFATVQAALDAADTDGNGGDVYLAAGTYQETLALRSRVSIYGGFDPATWRRDVSGFRPVIDGGPTAVSGIQANSLTIEGVEILAADAVDSGGSSIGLLLHNSTGVVIRMNRIAAGLGLPGADGADGNDGRHGGDGRNGTVWGNCPPDRTGGAGGSSPVGRVGGGGGTGGAAGGFDGFDGSGGGGGAGGTGGSTGNHGSPGGSGAPASEGSAGMGGTTVGMLDGSGYVPAVADAGNHGGHGWGGGGGGGGGGGLVFVCGGGGGGGGGGGERGTGGVGGQGGGGSLGIALAGASQAEIEQNEIETAGGGDGGTGGEGGRGGAGGARGSGGGCSPGIGCGGIGGHGTRGGHGGGGGGGMGGPSYGILEGVDATSSRTGNVFTLGPAGAGGAGGASPGNHGSAGGLGEQAEFKKLT